MNAVIQLKLSGQGGGNWYMTIRDGTCTVTEGLSSAPQATMSMAAGDYLRVAEGKLSGMVAILTGRVKVTGDLMLLKKMESWFAR